MSESLGKELLERITELKGDATWAAFAAEIGTSLARSGVIRSKLKKEDLSVKMDFLNLVAEAYDVPTVSFVFDGRLWIPAGYKDKFRANLGLRLKDFRMSRRLSCYDVAKAAKMNPQSITNYEKGSVWPTIEVVSAVSRAVNTVPFYLPGNNT